MIRAQRLIQATLLLVFAAMLCKRIHLEFSDLGRHLMNGKLILSGIRSGQLEVLHRNLYSYTFPGFPFPNHHWGFGVIAELIRSTLGFSGLSIAYLLLGTLAAWVAYALAVEGAGFWVATGLGLIALPLIAARSEIRPEGFSSLFAVLFAWALTRKTGRFLIILPLLSLLWVNIHIYFFLGWLIIAAFIAEAAFRRDLARVKALSLTLAGCAALSFVNPLGWKLVAFPFSILGNYGYPVAENQPVLRLAREGLITNQLIPFLVLQAIAFAGAFASRARRFPLGLALTAGGACLMTWFAARNLSLFGLLAWPACAALAGKVEFSRGSFARATALALLAFQGVFLCVRILPEIHYRFGIGLEPETEKAARFLMDENIQGPIFNNFDLAGYLIYYLFPARKVFVDNRPEAYPADFFQKTYIPMQWDQAKWREIDARFHFNSIVLHWRDPTPWNLEFRRARGIDLEWAPVFMDASILIFLRRTPENAAVIAKYELRQ